MNIQQLNEYCQKEFKQSLRKYSWSEEGHYYVQLFLPNGVKIDVNEKVDSTKPDGYYKTHTLQLAVDEAEKQLLGSAPSVSKRNIPSEFFFPDTNKGRASYRKCMATALTEGRFSFEEVNNVLYVPFSSIKEAQNLSGQLQFSEEMTDEKILFCGKKQENRFRNFITDLGWTKEMGRLASTKK